MPSPLPLLLPSLAPLPGSGTPLPLLCRLAPSAAFSAVTASATFGSSLPHSLLSFAIAKIQSMGAPYFLPILSLLHSLLTMKSPIFRLKVRSALSPHGQPQSTYPCVRQLHASHRGVRSWGSLARSLWPHDVVNVKVRAKVGVTAREATGGRS